MIAWWDSLSNVLQLFYGVAFIGTGLLMVQAILILVGAEVADLQSGGMPHDMGGGHSGGLEMLSLRSLVAFSTGFGWVGVIALKSGQSLVVAAILATLAGLVLAGSIIWLMRSMRRFESDGTLIYSNAIGTVGTVVVSTQPHGSSGGQVEVMVQGRLAVIAAVGDPAAPVIAPGTKVTVLALTSANSLLVSPA
jgi:hypothetical protein